MKKESEPNQTDTREHRIAMGEGYACAYVAAREREGLISDAKARDEASKGYRAGYAQAHLDRDETAPAVTSVANLKALVDEQSEDEGLWSIPVDGLQRIAEAHLQQELRKLHMAAEAVIRVRAP